MSHQTTDSFNLSFLLIQWLLPSLFLSAGTYPSYICPFFSKCSLAFAGSHSLAYISSAHGIPVAISLLIHCHVLLQVTISSLFYWYSSFFPTCHFYLAFQLFLSLLHHLLESIHPSLHLVGYSFLNLSVLWTTFILFPLALYHQQHCPCSLHLHLPRPHLSSFHLNTFSHCLNCAWFPFWLHLV